MTTSHSENHHNVRPMSGWMTSDGEFFVDQVTAQIHQDDLNFRNWCSENVCVGGEWDSRMVASAILERWHVRSKFPSAPEDASGTQNDMSGTPGQSERISTKEPAPGRKPPNAPSIFSDDADDDIPF